MNLNLFYVSFEGDKDKVPPIVTQTVHQQLAQEEVCLSLPEKNWVVITEKNLDTLQKCLYNSTDSDTLYVYASSEYNMQVEHLQTYIQSQQEENAQLRQELHEARNTLIELMQKNGALMEENTTLRLAQLGSLE